MYRLPWVRDTKKVNLLYEKSPPLVFGGPFQSSMCNQICYIGEAVSVTLKMLKAEVFAGPFFTGLNRVVTVVKTHYTVLEHFHGFLFSLDSQY